MSFISDKKTSEHYFVRQNINNATSFTAQINISFIPKKMTLRYANYRHTTGDIGLSLIRCHALVKGGEGILCSISDGVICPMSEFIVDFPVRGLYTFEIIDATGALDATREGTVVIDLEFSN